MGLRSRKKVEHLGATTTHEGYIYHGYLQIACVNLQKPYQAAERYITRDPTQPTATRPLALQQKCEGKDSEDKMTSVTAISIMKKR